MARIRQGARAVIVGTVLAALAGCATPKAVVGMDMRGDQMKMLYQHGGEFGVVRCKAAPDGALSQCADVKVNLED